MVSIGLGPDRAPHGKGAPHLSPDEWQALLQKFSSTSSNLQTKPLYSPNEWHALLQKFARGGGVGGVDGEGGEGGRGRLGGGGA